MRYLRWRSLKQLCQNGFSKFCFGDFPLKDEKRSNRPDEVDYKLPTIILATQPIDFDV